MKGLLYSWLYNKKGYFIGGCIVFAAVCAAMLIILPLIDFENTDSDLPYVVNMIVFILGLVVMIVFGESLDKELEHMLNSRFADYALTAGMTKKGFVNALLVRNLICVGISAVLGGVIMCLYIVLTKQPVTADLLVIVPCIVLGIHSIDFMLTPLVIKYNNAEKAGLILGLFLGLIIFGFMVFTSVYDNDEMLEEIMFKASTLLIISGVLTATYIPSYFITLRSVKRGDLC